jgi:hypothetical protein
LFRKVARFSELALYLRDFIEIYGVAKSAFSPPIADEPK